MSVENLIKVIMERGRQDVHAESFVGDNKKLSYRPVDGPVTPELLDRHRGNGPYLGVYFLSSDSTKTGIAAVDLDDKSGEVGPEKMRDIAIGIYRKLSASGFQPILERSGSGTGLHIWLIFSELQEAGRIRTMLLNILTSLGLKEGTGGVKAQEVEIFPRQVRLEPGKYGNLIALPYNRKSVILTPNFDPVAEHLLGRIDTKFSRNIIDRDCKQDNVDSKEHKKGRTVKEVETPPTLDEVRQALSLIPNEDVEYDDWLQMLYSVHDATDGSADGYDAFLEWSMKSEKHDQHECDKAWNHTKTLPEGVTWRTLMHKAKEHGWCRFAEIADRYVFVADQDMFYSLDSNISMGEGAFRRNYMHLHKDMSSYLLGLPTFKKVESQTYWPGEQRIVLEGNTRKFNRWIDPRIEAVEGDCSPFEEHMKRLVPGELERGHILDFLAFIIQNPGCKIRHAVVIQGKQGAGKSYLGEMMKLLLGPPNVRAISNNSVKSDFNGWLANASMVIVEEIMAKGRLEMMNNIKTAITQDMVEVNEKHEKPYSMPNRVNFLMFTNFEDALILEPGDRRYFVYFSPVEPEELPEKYFDDLFAWTTKNLSALKAFFLKRDVSGFNENKHPPMTDAKRKLLQLSKPEQQIVVERIMNKTERPPLLQKDVVDFVAILKTFQNEGKDFPEKVIDKYLREMGCKNYEGTVWIIRNVEEWVSAGPEAIMSEYRGKQVIQGGATTVGPNGQVREAF